MAKTDDQIAQIKQDVHSLVTEVVAELETKVGVELVKGKAALDTFLGDLEARMQPITPK